MTPPLPPVSHAVPGGPRTTPLDAAAADRLEASFLEEMLKYVGPRTPTDPLSGGGVEGGGESEFQSFLTQQYAARIAARLDLGLVTGPAA